MKLQCNFLRPQNFGKNPPLHLAAPPLCRFDRDVWFNAKPPLKAGNPLMNLPYIIDGDVVVAQTNACFSYLGRKLGLWGSTEAEVVDCEQLLCELMDLRNQMVGFAYSPAGPEAAAALLKRVSAGLYSL